MSRICNLTFYPISGHEQEQSFVNYRTLLGRLVQLPELMSFFFFSFSFFGRRTFETVHVAQPIYITPTLATTLFPQNAVSNALLDSHKSFRNVGKSTESTKMAEFLRERGQTSRAHVVGRPSYLSRRVETDLEVGPRSHCHSILSNSAVARELTLRDRWIALRLTEQGGP